MGYCFLHNVVKAVVIAMANVFAVGEELIVARAQLRQQVRQASIQLPGVRQSRIRLPLKSIRQCVIICWPNIS